MSPITFLCDALLLINVYDMIGIIYHNRIIEKQYT